MGLTDRIRKIVLEEVQQVSRFKDVLRFWLGLFYHVAQKAWEDSFAQRAAALAFFTLLNFLPIVGILLFVLSHSPIFKENMASVERVLVEQLVTPAARQVVIDLFASISKNLYVLGSGASGVLAILILLFLGTSLLRMVERSLNEIFRSPDAKGAILSRTIYLWAAVTLLPVFLGLSFALSRHVRHALGGALAVFQYLLPYGVTFAGFILLYRFIPKARVKMKAVLIAALFSSILWETAKLGLSAYVQEVFSRSPVSRLYGSLALIPIGMVWIYYSWIIVLLGAELAYVLHNFEQMQVEARKRWHLGKGFVPLSRQVALALLLEVFRSYSQGEGPANVTGMASAYQVHPAQTLRWFEALEHEGTVVLTKEEGILPSRPPKTVPLADVAALYDATFQDFLPSGHALTGRWGAAERESFKRCWRSTTFEDLLDGEKILEPHSGNGRTDP
jgi:membrane protein